jgi:sulfatase maturation enzyme AslB (radical SAM superfamily)
MCLEISSNGLYPERIEPVIKKYPDVKIRFSLEGFEATNSKIRGEDNGFKRKTDGLLRLKELGGTDLGFAITIQDDNLQDVVELFRFAEKYGFELATSTLHNGFQFHKSNNVLYDRLRVARSIERLITAQLKTYNVKNWFRAYLNLGLISKALGHKRLLPCSAATDFAFVDPWSNIYACNVRPDLKFGNLAEQPWMEIFSSSQMQTIRNNVYNCRQNCWMVGSAKTAMRHPKIAKFPKKGPLFWVIHNKFRAIIGQRIPFERYIDYLTVYLDNDVPFRQSYLGHPFKRKAELKDDPHYTDQYINI